MAKGVAVAAIVSLVLHLLIGWMWVAAGAAIAGWMSLKKPALVGGLGVSIGWTLLIIYNLLVAPGQVSEMARVTASLLGGLPAVFTYLVTVAVGFAVGVFGGFLGATLRSLFYRENSIHG